MATKGEGIRAQARALRARARARAQGVKAPIQLELRYERELNKIINEVDKAIKKELYPVLKATEFMYIADSIPPTVEAAMYNLNMQFAELGTLPARIALAMAESGDDFNRRKFHAGLNKAFGVELGGVISDAGINDAIQVSVAENVGLIKTIPEQYLARVKDTVLQGVDKGHDFFSIKKDLISDYDITKNRARLIARDQVSKLNGNLSQIRQSNAGITHYFWRTSGDSNVRDSHRDIANDRFAWNDPPIFGHPGQDIQCRCTADPDFSTLNLNLNI